MPGYVNWKVLYREEYLQLMQEGYCVQEIEHLNEEVEECLPFPHEMIGNLSVEEEIYWKESYERLWKVRNKGIRKDFPYEEPEDFEDIQKGFRVINNYEEISKEEYRKRIYGAIYGRFAAVILGKPLEMGWGRKEVKDYLESTKQYPLNEFVEASSKKLNITLREDCFPSTKGNIEYMQPDDDIHYTILALLLVEQYGIQFTKEDIGKLWIDNVPYHWFWCSSRQAYYNYINLEENEEKRKKIDEIPTMLNPWRECLDGQIRTDMWGYIFPGEPYKAASLAYKDCSYSLTKNGIYAGMFVAACVSVALTEKVNIDQILDGGLSVIPAKSRTAQAVKDVRNWYKKSGDWIKVCDKIYEKYGELPFAGVMNNLSIVVLSLLHGKLNYTKTITTAVMCGLDTDCNAGTAGSIVGAAIGMEKIDKRWVEPFHNTVKTVIASFGQGKISDVADRIIKVREKISRNEM